MDGRHTPTQTCHNIASRRPWRSYQRSPYNAAVPKGLTFSFLNYSREAESLSGKLSLFFKIARERPHHDPRHFPKSGTDEEKEAWEAREAREWIEKVKPIYAEDVDWSLSVEAFEKGKKDSTENNLNFTHRFKGLWDTMIETCGREKAAVIPLMPIRMNPVWWLAQSL